MIRLTPPEGDLRAGARGSAEAHQIRAGRLNYRVAPDRSVGQGGHVMPAGNPAPSRAHRELALPLRRHKDRPRFGRLHDCGLGELGFAAPGGIISLQGRHHPGIPRRNHPVTDGRLRRSGHRLRGDGAQERSLGGEISGESSPAVHAMLCQPPKAPLHGLSQLGFSVVLVHGRASLRLIRF